MARGEQLDRVSSQGGLNKCDPCSRRTHVVSFNFDSIVLSFFIFTYFPLVCVTTTEERYFWFVKGSSQVFQIFVFGHLEDLPPTVETR